jgi:hypothetical protein
VRRRDAARRSAPAAGLLALALLLGTGRAAAQSVPPAPPAAGSPAPAPDEPPAATALETWLARPGRVVVERTRALAPIPLGGEARVALEAVVAFEPVREQERVLGVRVRLLGTSRTGRAALAYLDPFEVDDLARTLAALPTLEGLQRAPANAVEIRHVSRDGFGLVVALPPGDAPPRRALRFGGDPPLDLAVSSDALGQLRQQLDAARAFLFAR